MVFNALVNNMYITVKVIKKNCFFKQNTFDISFSLIISRILGYFILFLLLYMINSIISISLKETTFVTNNTGCP